jgi:2-(1,2-epoxy-1,2-dihydrophenyl)acetyl-CoA isomerase
MTEILVDHDEEEPIATVTISNPERRNAMDSEGSMALAQTFRDLDADDGVRCVVLRGDGEAFCAGADLASTSGGATTAQSIDRGFHEAVRQLMTTSMPVIAKVQGPAVGAGASIATASDFVYTDESARVGFVFANIGLTADSGATFILPRLVGVQQAMDLLTSARILDAEEANEIGLTTEVLPDADALDERVHERAVELANGPTRAIAAIRRMLLRSNANSLEEQLELESREQEIMFHTDDVEEGMGAFMENRDPEFEGK